MNVSSELREYHESGAPLICEIDVQPWRCEFWPIAEVEKLNEKYEVSVNVPGHMGFATSGGGEIYAFSPEGSVVCLAFIGMSPRESLFVAPSWAVFKRMLRDAV